MNTHAHSHRIGGGVSYRTDAARRRSRSREHPRSSGHKESVRARQLAADERAFRRVVRIYQLVFIAIIVALAVGGLLQLSWL